MINHKRVQGIALVQVLLIVGIISVYTVLITKNAQIQLTKVDVALAARTAELESYAIEQELLFNLLTHNMADATPISFDINAETHTAELNFYGTAFNIGNYAVSITSLNSLIPLSASAPRLEKLFQLASMPPGDARRLALLLAGDETPAMSLTNQGAPNLPLVHPHEINLVSEQQAPEMALKNIALISSAGLNPYHSPAELLPMFVSQTDYDTLLQNRASATLDQALFSRITGIFPDEVVSFYPGPELRIAISREDEYARYQQVTDYKISPHDKTPVLTLYRH